MQEKSSARIARSPISWRAGYVVITLVVGAGVFVGSLWGTVAFLDYIDSLHSDSKDLDAVVFALSVDGIDQNWQPVTPDTHVKISENQLVVNSRSSLEHYEVIFTPFATKKGARYAISYEMEVTNGGLMIGVQSNDPPKFIRSKLVANTRDTLTFTAISKKTQIELINSSRLPTAAKVKHLVITEIYSTSDEFEEINPTSDKTE
jgi:hypothetical protein